MSSDNKEILLSHDNIREIAKKHALQFGDEETLKLLTVISMEYFYLLDSCSDEYLDFNDYLKIAKEVALFNFSAEKEEE